MFKIISAQSFETLEQSLLDQLMQPGSDPFIEDQVLIPSAAIQRRLTFSIADRYSICARVGFSFVATWLWQQVVELLKDFPERSPFDSNTLRWRIFKRFEDVQFLTAHPRLRAYLDNADATMRFDLACQVASLFDQYTTFRADWLEAWAAGRVIATRADSGDERADELWQSDLWRSLLNDIGGQLHVHVDHPSQIFLKALAEAASKDAIPKKFKQTVHVFCVPSLPPLYLAWLRGLATYRDVILYVMDPCQEYWHDLIPSRELARRHVSGDLDYQEVGHRLLSSWGRQTQAYVKLLMSQEGDLDVVFPHSDHKENATGNTLLNAVQAGIHQLQDLTVGSLNGRVSLDGSIQIHSCHSLTRELEVLQDCLLARFKEPHPPRPEDILVVVPDLDKAAPLIEGVFGHAPKDCFIPFMISGVAPISVSPCAQSILTILKLARSRLTLGEVLEALRLPLVADAVGIPLDEVDTVALWLKKANIRWGLDAQHRIELGLPSSDRHSFEEGLDRLLLGYAMPENFQRLWQGQMPVESVEGTEAQYLAALALFLENIKTLHVRLEKALTAGEWSSVLDFTMQTFLKPNADIAQEVQTLVQGMIDRSHEMLDAMPEDAAIPVDVLMRAFEEGLKGRAKGGVPTGSVTFSAMPSLRALPHRYVCILGLNDQEFPTPHQHIEFDLIARAPRDGDRQRHHDERNLFLDLLLSARERLHLSYVGKDRRDNALLPPSVVLAEFIEALIPALSAPQASTEQKDKIRHALITEHPLQAFSETYFEVKDTVSPFISFRKKFAQALQERNRNTTLRAGQEDENRMLKASFKEADTEDDGEASSQLEQELDRLSFGLSAPFYDSMVNEELEPEWRIVSLGQLIRFMQNPVRFYLTQRLGLEMPWVDKDWPETEDFEPAKNAASHLAHRLLPGLLECAQDAHAVSALARAGREFPEGLGGLEALALATIHIQEFAERVRSRLSTVPISDRASSLLFNLTEGEVNEEWTLEGVADSLYGSSQIRFHFGSLNENQRLELWCRHLWLCAIAEEGEHWTTEWLGSDDTWIFNPVSCKEAQRLLQDLLELYVQGLHAPLHFFPQSAWAYIEAEEDKPGNGLKEAMKKWMPSRYKMYAEGANMEYRLAFRGAPMPLDRTFEELAKRVLNPLRKNVQSAPLEAKSNQNPLGD
jgi:exodeoxyribonuclease V gamma subunit